MENQPGTGHVNNRADSYVISLFRSLGFERDSRDSQRLRAEASDWNLRHNVYVYKRAANVRATDQARTGDVTKFVP